MNALNSKFGTTLGKNVAVAIFRRNSGPLLRIALYASSVIALHLASLCWQSGLLHWILTVEPTFSMPPITFVVCVRLIIHVSPSHFSVISLGVRPITVASIIWINVFGVIPLLNATE
jgi:hypothetical protein